MKILPQWYTFNVESGPLFNYYIHLSMDNGTVLQPNDLYELHKETFRLYYQSFSSETQTIDVYFFDNQGNGFTLSFQFMNDNAGEETRWIFSGIAWLPIKSFHGFAFR